MDTLYTNSSFWQSTFGISNETAFQTLVPTAIALFVFIAGQLLNRWWEYSKERKKTTAIKQYVSSQLEVLQKATSEQIKKVDEYLAQLKIDKIFSMEFARVVDFNTTHIRMIKTNDLFEIIVVKDKEKRRNRITQFNSLIKQLDLIDGLNNSFLTSFEYSQEHFHKYEDKWNDNIDIIGDYHDNWLTTLTSQDIDPRNDPFLKDFYSIYHSWSKIKNYSDMYVALEVLIKPTIESAKKFQPNRFGESLLRPLLHCLDAVNNHKNLRNNKIKEFNFYKTQLESIVKELSVIKDDNI